MSFPRPGSFPPGTGPRPRNIGSLTSSARASRVGWRSGNKFFVFKRLKKSLFLSDLFPITRVNWVKVGFRNSRKINTCEKVDGGSPPADLLLETATADGQAASKKRRASSSVIRSLSLESTGSKSVSATNVKSITCEKVDGGGPYRCLPAAVCCLFLLPCGCCLLPFLLAAVCCLPAAFLLPCGCCLLPFLLAAVCCLPAAVCCLAAAVCCLLLPSGCLFAAFRAAVCCLLPPSGFLGPVYLRSV